MERHIFCAPQPNFSVQSLVESQYLDKPAFLRRAVSNDEPELFVKQLSLHYGVLIADIAGAVDGFKILASRVEQSLLKSAETRRQRLITATKKPKKRTIKVTGYYRNSDVVAEVLRRADGSCEGCEELAPFTRRKDLTPYLEVHHKIMLSQGGEDSVENAVALCPNCHRERHFGVNG
jgi:5-methylcytosine-specific restriction endonuclease McrA